MNKESFKKCNKCLEIKELGFFEKRPDSKDGFRNYCRSCKNKRQTQRITERILKDDVFFWKTRANYLNNASGRRRGKAGFIISSSEPIKAEELLELYILQNKSCSYCKITLDKKDIVFDHKIPLSREGKHDINNLVVSCKDCNNLKSTRNSEEFANFLKLYISRFC